MTDILEWLIEYTEYDADPSHRNKLKEAADTIKALRAENARLREALKPFARLQKLEWKVTMFENRRDDDAVFYHHATGTSLTLGDFRAARAALEKKDG